MQRTDTKALLHVHRFKSAAFAGLHSDAGPSETRLIGLVLALSGTYCLLSLPALDLLSRGISDVTLYHWRKQARAGGMVVPGDGKNPENWSPEDKFAVVLETAALSEAEFAEYCRKKGLYAEQVAVWKENCMKANATAVEQAKAARDQARGARKEIKEVSLFQSIYHRLYPSRPTVIYLGQDVSPTLAQRVPVKYHLVTLVNL